jgi:DNA-directed RNA polymerase subunit RPC12/RpoP
MKYFCSKCGKTTQYNFELPKFCAFCGQSFASKTSSTPVEDKRNKFLNELKLKKNINSIEVDDESYDTIDSNIDFKKIKPSFKLDVYQPKGESFGSLIDNPSSPIEINNQNNIQTKTKEEILSEFQKEAGSLRSK